MRDWPKDVPSAAGTDFWRARALASIGHNGTLEEKLLRLMVFAGSSTYFDRSRHSGCYEPLAILTEGTAWCDQSCIVWMHYVHEILHLPTRILAIKHSDLENGHTVAEAEYEGRFHLFDVATDHQAVYRERNGTILGYDELVLVPYIVSAEGHWWRGRNGAGKEGFYWPGSLMQRHAYAAVPR